MAIVVVWATLRFCGSGLGAAPARHEEERHGWVGGAPPPCWLGCCFQCEPVFDHGVQVGGEGAVVGADSAAHAVASRPARARCGPRHTRSRGCAVLRPAQSARTGRRRRDRPLAQRPNLRTTTRTRRSGHAHLAGSGASHAGSLGASATRAGGVDTPCWGYPACSPGDRRSARRDQPPRRGCEIGVRWHLRRRGRRPLPRPLA
jgi:hypothetical protein